MKRYRKALKRARGVSVPASVMVSLFAGGLVLSAAAVAQEPFPWAKFVELTERKGSDVTQGGPCQHLGLDPDCRAWQAASQDDEWTHAFNVVRAGTARSGRLILFKRSDAGVGRFYLTDLKGKLLRAVARREGTPAEQSAWSKLEIGSREVRRGFAAELTYWRGKRAELEKEPDRKN